MTGELTMENAAGNRVPLPRLEPEEAAKTLGVYMAPDGRMDEEIEYLTEKATDFTAAIRGRGPGTRNDFWIAYNHTISKTMEYPMPASTINEQQWREIYTTSQ